MSSETPQEREPEIAAPTTSTAPTTPLPFPVWLMDGAESPGSAVSRTGKLEAVEMIAAFAAALIALRFGAVALFSYLSYRTPVLIWLIVAHIPLILVAVHVYLDLRRAKARLSERRWPPHPHRPAVSEVITAAWMTETGIEFPGGSPPLPWERMRRQPWETVPSYEYVPPRHPDSNYYHLRLWTSLIGWKLKTEPAWVYHAIRLTTVLTCLTFLVGWAFFGWMLIVRTACLFAIGEVLMADIVLRMVRRSARHFRPTGERQLLLLVVNKKQVSPETMLATLQAYLPDGAAVAAEGG